MGIRSGKIQGARSVHGQTRPDDQKCELEVNEEHDARRDEDRVRSVKG